MVPPPNSRFTEIPGLLPLLLALLLLFAAFRMARFRKKRQTRHRCTCCFLLVVADSKTAMFVETIGRIQTWIQRSNMQTSSTSGILPPI